MNYPGQNYDRLLGMPGFSDESLDIHFRLYEGYVARFNGLIGILDGMDRNSPSDSEIKENFAWEFNGVRLHETYFGNITKDFQDLDPDSGMAAQIDRDFGSMESWESDFWEVSCTPGDGWAVLAWDPVGNRLVNRWVTGHAVGTLFYCVSLLVNDCFDHTYMTDYGDDRSDYIGSFLKIIDWVEVNKRFDAIVQLTRAVVYAF